MKKRILGFLYRDYEKENGKGGRECRGIMVVSYLIKKYFWKFVWVLCDYVKYKRVVLL